MGTIFDLLYVEKVMLKKNHLEVDFQIETFKKNIFKVMFGHILYLKILNLYK